MSRLTTSQNYCDDCDFGREKECFFDGEQKFNCKDKQIYDKLKEYEDLEEQGLLLRLPYKVEDTVWYIDDDDDDYPLELLVTKIEVEENDYLRYHAREKDNCGKIGFINDDIGKTVFLTKEEAEQKLKEMERENK